MSDLWHVATEHWNRLAAMMSPGNEADEMAVRHVRGAYAAMQMEIDRLTARVRELEDALRPFAELIIVRDGMQYVSRTDVDRARRLLGLEVER